MTTSIPLFQQKEGIMSKQNPAVPALEIKVHYAQGVIHSVDLTPTISDFTLSFQSPQTDPALESCVREWLKVYMQKKSPERALPFAWDRLPAFTRRALQAVGDIPFGSVSTYGQVAASIGSPDAPRAVGGACQRNPFVFFIPCHRVLDSKYDLRAYSAGGIVIKQILLNFEGASFRRT